MNITFNLVGTGLANNGGSLTIVKSANVLQRLGHSVSLVSDIPNKFTWHKLEAKFIHLSGGREDFHYPDADVNIATGFQSVKHVCLAPLLKGKRYHWIRANETWIVKDVSKVYSAPTRKFVNSIGLKRYIENTFDVSCEILYPGVDFDTFYNIKPERFKTRHEKILIGALFNRKPRKRFEWVEETFIYLKKKYGNKVALVLFGDSGRPLDLDPKFKFLYVQQPSAAQLRQLYNLVHVWLAPTESEGLHICPLEAVLCGCLVVGTDAPLAGLDDWLIDNHTGFIARGIITNDYWDITIKDAFLARVEEAINCPEGVAYTLHRNAEALIRMKIGTRIENMKKFVSIIQEDIEDII